MENKYDKNAKIFKALSDPNRLKIIDMLSCGELCACNILEEFNITQPTLSHHMKILKELELVTIRREGKWMYYNLNEEKINEFKDFINILTITKSDCICK